jgi:O-antigen/teichoic acid export membrane protein
MGDNLIRNSLGGRLLSGGAWTLAGRFVTVVAGFLVNALIARIVSAEEVGVYFLLVSIVTLGTVAASLGLQVIVVRLVAEYMAGRLAGLARSAVLAVLKIVSISSLVIAVAVGMSGRFIAYKIFNSPIISSVIWYAASWIFVLALLNLLAESFRGFHDFKFATIFSNNTSANVLLVVFLSAFIGFGFHGALRDTLTFTILSCVVSLLFAAYFMWRRLRNIEVGKPIKATFVLNAGLPLMLSSLSIFVLTQADIWVIGMFSSPEAVAKYGAAMRLGQLLFMPLLISNTLLPPFIAEMYAQGKLIQLENVMRIASTLSVIPAGVALLAFIFVGDFILEMAYGEYYRSAYYLLLIIGVGQFVNVWSGSGMIALINTGHQRSVMGISFGFGSLIVLGAIVVVRHYGVTGVALVTASVTAVQAIFTLLLLRKKTGMWVHAGTSYLSLVLRKVIS